MKFVHYFSKTVYLLMDNNIFIFARGVGVGGGSCRTELTVNIKIQGWITGFFGYKLLHDSYGEFFLL